MRGALQAAGGRMKTKDLLVQGAAQGEPGEQGRDQAHIEGRRGREGRQGVRVLELKAE